MIKSITLKRLNWILSSNLEAPNGKYTPYGKYITYDRSVKKWVALDNSDGMAWLEEFEKLCDAIKWLRS